MCWKNEIACAAHICYDCQYSLYHSRRMSSFDFQVLPQPIIQVQLIPTMDQRLINDESAMDQQHFNDTETIKP